MRILHVIPSISSRTGGPAIAVAGAAKALTDLGSEITIASTDQATPAQARSGRDQLSPDLIPADAYELDLKVFPVSRLARWAHSPGLADFLRCKVKTFDVVHIHSLNLHTQFAAYRQCKHQSVPFVVTPHAALDPYINANKRLLRLAVSRTWQQQMLNDAGALHFGSVAELEISRRYFSNPRTYVIPNGVGLSSKPKGAGSDPVKVRPLAANSAPQIVNHGRISEKKGLDQLIRAVAMAHEQFSGLQLTLIGPDDEALTPALTQLAQHCGIGDHVHFLGPLYGSDLFAALAHADLWILPSWSEGASMALNEALAMGLPVIISPHVSTAAEGREANALVVSDNSPSMLSAEIVQLLRDQQRRTELNSNARAYAASLTWDSIAQKYLHMYDEAIQFHTLRQDL